MISEIQVSRIVPSNLLSMRIEEEGEEFEELLSSIKRVGLIEPIVVRAVQQDSKRSKDECFEVVCGHRRFAACKKLNFESLACKVVELEDREAFEIALAENIQRKSLSPIEEAEAFKSYVINFGRGGITRLARNLGKSEEYVSHRLLLLGLPKHIVELISRRLLKPALATEIMWLNEPQSQIELTDEVMKSDLTMRETRDAVKLLRSERMHTQEAVKLVLSKRGRNGESADTLMLENNPWPDSISHRKQNESTTDIIDHATLILRTCLSGLDMLISKAPTQSILSLLMAQRQSVHDSLDQVIRAGVMQKRMTQMSSQTIQN